MEDEDAVRGLCREILSLRGYRVLEADSADQARNAVAGHDQPVDLLITDIILPQGRGSQLAETLRQRYPGLKVLYMSGYAETFFMDEQGPAGRFHFLSKPFTAEDLARTVREILDWADGGLEKRDERRSGR